MSDVIGDYAIRCSLLGYKDTKYLFNNQIFA